MMRHFIGCLFAALGLFAASAHAQDREGDSPVVVELFTSQGCSSCPPADELLHDLAKRDDVIALSLHVDYWDYIGWKDVFAQPAFSARQKAYARAAHRRSIFTPQMIIGGRDTLVGHDAMQIVMTIDKQRRAPRRAVIEVISPDDAGATIRVRLVALAPMTEPGDVQLVRYTPSAKVEIRRGENAGKTFTYANVVREWTHLGLWDGDAAELQFEVPGSESAVLIVQSEDQREVLAAARLK